MLESFTFGIAIDRNDYGLIQFMVKHFNKYAIVKGNNLQSVN